MSMLSSVTVSKVTKFRSFGAYTGSSTAHTANATKKERRIMIVAVKTEDNIVLNPYNNPKLSKLVLKSSEVEDALLFKERPGVTKAIQSVEISESDLKKSNEDVQSVPASAADLLKEKPKTVKEIKAQLKQNQKDREDNCKIG